MQKFCIFANYYIKLNNQEFMKHFVITILFITSTLTAIAQTSVTPFDATKDYLNGITYSLPKTQLSVTVTARHTIEKPGPFYHYAERYLATKEIVTINNESQSISLEKFITLSKNINILDFIKFIDRLKLDTIYFLKGEDNE